MAKIKATDKKNKGKFKESSDIKEIYALDYPVFCFKHLDKKFNLSDGQLNEFRSLFQRLSAFGSMTWAHIATQPRHGYGWEKIEQNALKVSLPNHITKDVSIYAFRFHERMAFLGYRKEFVFHIIAFDRAFKAYDHGS